MPIKPAKPVDQAGAKKHAAGTIFAGPEGHILLLLRSSKEKNYAGHWGLPGGGVDAGETPESGATREAREEMGDQAPTGRKRLLDQRRTPNNWIFHTFAQACDTCFVPVLNDEHSGYGWFALDMLPTPIHPSIEATLKDCRVKDGLELHEWAGEHVLVEEMAMDEAFAFLAAEVEAQLGPRLAFDRAPDGLELDRPGLMVTLAFDREPEEQNQVVDGFERLHVKRVPITKACVNPYYGREIPKGKELGLQPDKIYRLLRDPKEIEKGAATSHNVPLLSKHVPHSADAHDGEITVGTVGSDAVYEHPYLYNSLAVWSREGRNYAEGDQKELSSAYAYDADMTPGEFEGEPYDGVMRNLKWNHVCLVKKGRAGSDIALDEALQPKMEISMSTKVTSLKAGVALGAVTAILRGVKLAQDAAIDLGPAFAHVKPGKFKQAKPKIVAGVKTALTGKLAQDSDLAAIIENVSNLIEAVDGKGDASDIVEDDAPMRDPDEIDQDTDDDGDDVAIDSDAIAAYLKSKGVPDDVIAGMPGKEKVAGDKDVVAEENGPAGKKDDEKNKEKPFDKGAMDAAIAAAETRTIARMNAVQAARDHVFPVAGKLEMAFDSAEGVYHAAFKLQGKDMSKVTNVDALKQVWDALPVPGKRQSTTVIAQDEASVDDFAKRYPNMAKVRKA